jgi:hypothetical protein
MPDEYGLKHSANSSHEPLGSWDELAHKNSDYAIISSDISIIHRTVMGNWKSASHNKYLLQ